MPGQAVLLQQLLVLPPPGTHFDIVNGMACLIAAGAVCFLHQAPRKFSSGVSGKMGYEDFVWFILSEEDKTTDTALEYWFRWVLLCLMVSVRQMSLCHQAPVHCPLPSRTGEACLYRQLSEHTGGLVSGCLLCHMLCWVLLLLRLLLLCPGVLTWTVMA